MPDARWSGVMRAFARQLLAVSTPLRVFLTVLFLVALITGAFAKPIRKGAVMQVKPNSIWFDESAQLTHWQERKRGGTAAGLPSSRERMLGRRDAWQFVKPFKVKILR